MTHMKDGDLKKTDNNSLLLDNILNHLNVAIAAVTADMKILRYNPSFELLFHLQEASIQKNTTLDELPGNFWKNGLLTYLKTNYDEQQFNFKQEFNWETDDHKTRNIHVVSQQLDTNDDGSQNLLLTFYDVTQERENELGRNQRIRHIMHELRNPLSNISLCVELLSDSVKENNQEEANMFLNKAANSIQRMKGLINDLNEIKHPVNG